MTETIPSPHGVPILGNVLDVDPEHPQESLARIAKIYGPIFRLRLPRDRIFVANYALARDLFDEKKFQKSVSGPLEQVRNATKDGLFTAYPGEHNWEIAHRTLMPAFGPLSIRGMFPEMQDIVSQMVLKWARFGPDTAINVADDFTRLTLDSIALCAMGDRFNSFYHESQHIFVTAMGGMLTESFARSRRPGFAGLLYQNQEKQYQADIEQLTQTARELLDSRRRHPTDKKDLLNALILNKDPKTGEKLGDDAIIRNMITFLIAGHETTSGLLSFLFYELLESPEAYRKAQEEVDRVIGKENITIDHLSKLPYLEACLREALRLHPTAPGFSLEAKGNQVLDGRYTIKDKEVVNVVLAQLHRDPEVYGSNAEEFIPSRMLDEEFAKLPPNAWKPFGNGVRACIGRPFAWQEALLALATLLQVFQFTKNNASYQLQIKTTLTIKPRDFYMNARVRDPEFLDKIGVSSKATPKSTQKASKQPEAPSQGGTPLLVLYGSNTGTCEALANELAAAAPDHGFTPQVKSLDSAAAALPHGDPIAIITASYEGQPPDNAAHFVEWLTATHPSDLKDIRFAVFGVGNKEWHTTYQKIPIVVDEALGKAGAQRLTERLAADVTQGNIFDKFNDWQDSKFWPAVRTLGGKTGDVEKATQKEFKIEINVQTRSSLLRQDVQLGEVSDVRLLTKPGAPRKRHIGIRLPTGLSYQAGDYLAVLPVNPSDTVHRVMIRFRLPWDATITIDPSTVTSLPTGIPITVYNVLSGMVELGQAATSRATAALIRSIPDAQLAEELEKRAAQEDFQKSNVTLLDLLEDYPSATYTLGQFLASVPPMRLPSESECTLTYSVIDAPAKGSHHGHRYFGVASTYLERLNVGDRLHISLRPSRAGFHLPVDDSTPIIMACAGTGLAPFHAFIQERAIKKAGGIPVGSALLFYGCGGPNEDDLYRDEFDKWQAQGVVDVRRAYSHSPQESKNCKHVQDRIWADRDEAAILFRRGARIYICGAGAVGLGIEKAMARIRAEALGEDEETCLKWVQDMKGERYWADVFA
ncbi:fatty acid hydroxylase [Aspergillus bertholletiae]|uniref:Bifunctional cytochrome P450/NADPH--P450 reductase n=1 Tax=Aspergillus bertholletiae TaxID=1226010 RepID=A0A5N7AZG1_9EURO|nr:fatty acid hydroxylase [Aspergillus bertholletiae]